MATNNAVNTSLSGQTGTGSFVGSGSPTLVTPNIGIPSAGTLTNCTGLPVSTGISGLAANMATFLATPSSVNLAAAVTDETGSGALVFGTSPTLVTPLLGTPTSGTMTNCTGLPVSTGISGLGTGVATFLAVPSSANLASAVTDETGNGALVFGTSPTLVTPLLGTPTSGTLTNCTGLPISSGVSGLGTGVATFLTTPSSANLASAITDETGSGSLVFATSPTLVTPILGTPTSGTLTNCTGLPIGSGVSGLAAGVATFLATPSSANLAAAVTNETGSGALVFGTSPTLVTPTLGAASATSISFSSTSGVIGTTTNDSAAAGSVGELIESNIASGSAVSLTTGTPANLTSISLTAGDWDVWGSLVFQPGGATTYTAFSGCINTTSASFSGAIPGAYFSLSFPNTTFNSGSSQAFPVGQKRISISGTTTVYIVAQAGFAASTLSVYGYIGARRRR